MALKQPRTVAPLTLSELQNLPTPRILAYLRKLQSCENSVAESDLEPHEVTVKGIVFKDGKEWQEQYAIVKSVLATRPNADNETKD